MDGLKKSIEDSANEDVVLDNDVRVAYVDSDASLFDESAELMKLCKLLYLDV